MATHSSTLAWKIPWTEEPGRLQSMGSLRVGHDWATSLSLFTFMHWRRKWQPTAVFLPGESRGGGAWWAAIYGVAQSWTRLKWLSSSSSSSQVLKSLLSRSSFWNNALSNCPLSGVPKDFTHQVIPQRKIWMGKKYAMFCQAGKQWPWKEKWKQMPQTGGADLKSICGCSGSETLFSYCSCKCTLFSPLPESHTS